MNQRVEVRVPDAESKFAWLPGVVVRKTQTGLPIVKPESVSYCISADRKGDIRPCQEAAKPKASVEFNYPEYLEVVAMSAEEAKVFIGCTDDPVDLRAADPSRYVEGARVWGFPSSSVIRENVGKLSTMAAVRRSSLSR